METGISEREKMGKTKREKESVAAQTLPFLFIPLCITLSSPDSTHTTQTACAFGFPLLFSTSLWNNKKYSCKLTKKKKKNLVLRFLLNTHHETYQTNQTNSAFPLLAQSLFCPHHIIEVDTNSSRFGLIEQFMSGFKDFRTKHD